MTPKLIYKDNDLTIIKELDEDMTASEFMQHCVDLANNLTYSTDSIKDALEIVII